MPDTEAFATPNQPNIQTVVAVLNTTEETMELLCEALAAEGYAAVSAYIIDFKRGRQNMEAFFHTHQPQVVVYDIALPYVSNWRFFQEHVLTSHFLPEHRFVLTTTNKQVLELLVGPTAAIQLIGKPFDLNTIMSAVAHALAI